MHLCIISDLTRGECCKNDKPAWAVSERTCFNTRGCWKVISHTKKECPRAMKFACHSAYWPWISAHLAHHFSSFLNPSTKKKKKSESGHRKTALLLPAPLNCSKMFSLSNISYGWETGNCQGEQGVWSMYSDTCFFRSPVLWAGCMVYVVRHRVLNTYSHILNYALLITRLVSKVYGLSTRTPDSSDYPSCEQVHCSAKKKQPFCSFPVCFFFFQFMLGVVVCTNCSILTKIVSHENYFESVTWFRFLLAINILAPS